jgi:hypothetical protein
MVVALHADVVVVLQRFGFHYLAAAGALEPHSFRNAIGLLGFFFDPGGLYLLKR